MNFKVSDLIILNKIPINFLLFLGIAGVIISGFFLFTPEAFLKYFKLLEFQKDYGNYFGVAFIVAIILVGFSILHYYNKNEGSRHLVYELKYLDPSEQSVLREFILQYKKSVKMPVNDPTVSGLIHRRILERISDVGEGEWFPVTLTKVADRKLKYYYLGIPKNLKKITEKEREYFLSNRPKWAKALLSSYFQTK